MKQLIALIAVAIIAGGCAHYRLGDGNKPAYSTIAFAPVINKSMAPQMQTLVSNALFGSFARGGGMAIESQEGAEATLQVTLKEYEKMIGASRSDDTGRARTLTLSLKATATLSDSNGVVIYTGDFAVTDEVYADSGAVRAENEAMPRIAQKLADDVYRAVVSKW